MTLSFRLIGTILLLTLIFGSCKEVDLEKDAPKCIMREIRKIKREEVRNPPAKVWEWNVDGATYYYITSDCCDQLNYLYDDDCNIVCAPDGGFSGGGDGTCPEFEGSIERTLVWEDQRTL